MEPVEIVVLGGLDPSGLAAPGQLATPGALNMVLYRGDSYQWQFNLWQDAGKTIPVDLTGATASAQIRESPNGTKISNLTCTTITLSGQTKPSAITMVLDTATSQAVVPSGVWDIHILQGGWQTTICSGTVTTTDNVTHTP